MHFRFGSSINISSEEMSVTSNVVYQDPVSLVLSRRAEEAILPDGLSHGETSHFWSHLSDHVIQHKNPDCLSDSQIKLVVFNLLPLKIFKVHRLK